MKDIRDGEGPNVVYSREYVGVNDESFPFSICENDEGRESGDEQHRRSPRPHAIFRQCPRSRRLTFTVPRREGKNVNMLTSRAAIPEAEATTSRSQRWTHGHLRSLWKSNFRQIPRLDTMGSQVVWLEGASALDLHTHVVVRFTSQ